MKTSRREFLTLSGAGFGAMATGYPTGAIAQSPETDVLCYGGSGGGAFGPFYPTSVGLAQGRDSDNAVRVNLIRINKTEYGSRNVDDGQLQERGELNFSEDEYITAGTIRWGHRHPVFGKDRPVLVDLLDLRTNKGQRTRTTGWSEYSREQKFSNVRVCTIAGRVGARVDRICFEVIRNYEPSQLIAENEPAVFEYHAPGSTLTEAESVEERRLTAWERVVTRQRTRTLSASVGVELMAGLVGLQSDLAGSLTTQNTTVTTVSNVLERTVSTLTQTVRETEGDHGFVVGRVNVYLDQEGNYYAVPSTGGTFGRYQPETLPLLHRALNFAPGLELTPVGMRSIPEPLYGGDIERLIVV